MKNTLSTITAARLLGVAAASIANWIDSGKLKAGRTPGGHRRIAREELMDFLRRQGLPVPPELMPSPRRVLVVDDDAAVARRIAGQIKAAHPEIDVLEANDGFSAGQIVALSRPDVVVLDLGMPGVDGVDVCRRIKARKTRAHTTVIATTALPSPEQERRILEAGASACLAKPLKIAELLTWIEEALQRRHGYSAIGARVPDAPLPPRRPEPPSELSQP